MPFTLWRQDEHGNRFLIGLFDERGTASELLQALGRREHRQRYWIEEFSAPSCSCPSPEPDPAARC